MSTFPEDLEAKLYEIAFELPAEQRGVALSELLANNPDHATDLEAHFRKLTKGLEAVPSIESRNEPVPERVGPYRILEKLGEGGFGVVYLAEQRDPVKRRVALKCLLPGMDSRKVLARFEAERQALALMNHPNIAQVFDAGTTDEGRPYFVMEYVPGVPLTEYCQQRKTDIQNRLEVFLQVCEGVQHAHQKGVIHRDLKPSNVLVTEQDGRHAVKIIDFGVAKALHQPLSSQTLHTEQGRMLGTPEYMSPEQAGGRTHDIDTRTDIYSLGVLLYELLTGTLPFEADKLRSFGLQEVQRVIQEEEPPRPSHRLTTVSRTATADEKSRLPTTADELRGDLDWVVMKCLEKEKHRRYDTAGGLLADVWRYLRNEPVLAHPPSRSYLLRKFLRRHRTEAMAGAIVLCALVASLILVIFAWVRVGQEAEVAKKNLGDFESLSDAVLLDRYQAEQEKLWPEHPDMIQPLETWLADARGLIARLPQHQLTLTTIQKRTGGDGKFEDVRDQFLVTTLTALTRRLTAFQKTLESVEERLDYSKRVKAETIDAHKQVWDEARASVKKDPRFRGLDLKPQVGLIPVGQDPDTDLWLFSHLRSGKPIKVNGTRLVYEAEKSGLVFVLLPGGSFDMGAQSENKKAKGYYFQAHPFESPIHAVTLDPFFLSKFEMTQSQWQRITGKNPSIARPRFTTDPDGTKVHRPYGGKPVLMHHPVENVSWFDCDRELRHLGLLLPTEAQWEYACRAGQDTLYYTGDDLKSLRGHVNLADVGNQKYLRAIGSRGRLEMFDDGYAVHAPVTDFHPNPFGLLAMHGNVEEWTRDWFKHYDKTIPRSGDGYRGDEPGEPAQRVTRGGSFLVPASAVRSARRGTRDPAARSVSTGVRPARALDH